MSGRARRARLTRLRPAGVSLFEEVVVCLLHPFDEVRGCGRYVVDDPRAKAADVAAGDAYESIEGRLQKTESALKIPEAIPDYLGRREVRPLSSAS